MLQVFRKENTTSISECRSHNERIIIGKRISFLQIKSSSNSSFIQQNAFKKQEKVFNKTTNFYERQPVFYADKYV